MRYRWNWTYGPTFRWFAWYPVWTDDRGLRWLTIINRRRCIPNLAIIGTRWVHCVKYFRIVKDDKDAWERA